MERVVLLNSDYSFLSIIPWQKAITLIVKGKVQVIKNAKRIIRNMERTVEIVVPLVLRLLKLIRTLYKTKVPFSKKNIIARDTGKCAYCGHKEDQRMTIDHVIPRSRGGKSTWENCVATCKKCNSSKGNKTPREAGIFLKRQPYQPTIHEFLQIKMASLGVDKILKEYVFNES